MSNNKQIEKHLELQHQETVVGINTIQTTPFDNQKITKMSNNKQSSSVEWLVQELRKFYEQPWKYDKQIIIEQAKAMHKEECKESYYESLLSNFQTFEQYYNETFGGNNDQQ